MFQVVILFSQMFELVGQIFDSWLIFSGRNIHVSLMLKKKN